MKIKKEIYTEIEIHGSDLGPVELAELIVESTAHYDAKIFKGDFLSDVLSEVQNLMTPQEFWKRAINSMWKRDEDMVIKMIVGAK